MAAVNESIINIPYAKSYPFELQRVPPERSTQVDPFFLDFHMTRYYGGCFFDLNEKYSYRKTVPWIHSFDLLVTTCDLNLDQPWTTKSLDTCVWTFHDDVKNHHLRERSNRVERIHVHSDPKHLKYLMDRVLPYFEERFKQTGQGIILHSGGGDMSCGPDKIPVILQNKCVFRWAMEQNVFDPFINHPKIVQLPVGICIRENVGQVGKELREVMPQVSFERRARGLQSMGRPLDSFQDNFPGDNLTQSASNRSSHDVVSQSLSSMSYNSSYNTQVEDILAARQTVTNTSQSSGLSSEPSADAFSPFVRYPRMLQDAMNRTMKWSERKNKIFLCFNEAYNRKAFLDYAKSHATVADVCNGSLSHADMWKAYGQYKFVFSPSGFGRDCGRSWEIMLMGAIPVIEYFAGAVGYLQGGLSAILVRNPEELNEGNLTKWVSKYTKPTEKYKLSRRYWLERVFDGLHGEPATSE